MENRIHPARHGEMNEENNMKMHHGSMYKKFYLAMLVSFIVMYALMFANVADSSHIMLSKMRTYMSLLMVSAMGIFMMAIMWKMYPDAKKNAIILGISALVFIFSFIAIRTQLFISDVDYMKGMIPHHLSAILTSSKAHIADPETRKLADNIIAAQEKEISMMKQYIDRLKNNK